MVRRASSSNFRLKSQVPYEYQEQIVAANWLTKNNIPFYHIPNGGRRNAIEGAKFKAMGVKPGIPDICVIVAKNGFHGLYIELKRKVGGDVSEMQKYWMWELRRQGYDVFVANGADELIKYVQNYLRSSANEQGKANE